MLICLRTLCVVVAFGVLDALPPAITCSKLADVYWNVSNSIFRIDNTDHIIDVNKGNIPFEYDQVNIICPVYSPGTKEEDVEQYVIYNVSKEEYDSCRITNPDPRIIAVCDKPQQLMYFTITFRSFTPQPGGLEFRPGQDYYFISTSSGGQGGLHQRIGGRCATHNMKVIFKVCCDPSKRPNIPATPRSKSSTTTSTASSRSSGVPFFSTTSSSSRSLSSTTPASTTVKSVYPSSTLVPPFWLRSFSTIRPPYKTYEVPIDGVRKKSSKKSEDRDKLPNETRAKNEELVNNADVRCRSTLVTCLNEYLEYQGA